MDFRFENGFGRCVCDGDSIQTKRDTLGRFFRATVVHDEDAEAPWDDDGHGPVSDWRPLSSKRPGERVLGQDRGQARFCGGVL